MRPFQLALVDRRLRILLVVCLALCLALVGTQGFFTLDGKPYFVLGDDAMISMRYAHNLAAGDGLFWNRGGSPEGYTNFLWTSWMVVPHLLHVPENLAALFVLSTNLALGAVYVVLLYEFAARLRPTVDVSPIVAASLGGLAFQFCAWSCEGFETTLLALTSLVAWRMLLERRFVLLSGALAIGLLSRDDFAIVAVLFIAAASGPLPPRPARVVRCGALPIAAHTGHLIFRVLYYGRVLPNTYYLKVTGLSPRLKLAYGAAYVGGALPALAVAVLGFGFVLSRHRDAPAHLRSALLAGAAVPLGYAAYALYVGGDALLGTRLLAPAWPMIAMGAALLVQHLRSQSDRATKRILPIAVAGLAIVSPLNPDGLRNAFGLRPLAAAALDIVRIRPLDGATGSPRAFDSSRLGKTSDPAVTNVAACEEVKRDASARGLQSPSMAVYYAGVAPYFCSEFRAIDLLGKSDQHIAGLKAYPGRPGHNKWDYDHSLGTLQADYLMSLLPSVESLHDSAYRRQPDGSYNWHHLLESQAFWDRCASTPLRSFVPLVFSCAGATAAVRGPFTRRAHTPSFQLAE